jgi:hypothetical protein
LRNLIIISILFCSAFYANSQNFKSSEFAFFGGKSFYRFQFRADNQNEGIQYRYRDGYNYGVSQYFSWNERYSMRGELIAYQAGSQADYGGNMVSWKLNYIGLGGAYLFSVIEKNQFFKYRIETGLNVGFDYLLNAYQQVNSITYNLKEEGSLKPFNLRVGPVVRVRYNPIPKIYLGLEYRFDYGLLQIEDRDQEIGQKTNNMGHMAQAFVSLRMF